MAKYNTAQLQDLLKQGKAIDAGDHIAFPINDKEDVTNAIGTIGLTKLPAVKVRAHIIKRAKALGFASLIPTKWNADGTLNDGKQSNSVASNIVNELRMLAANMEREIRAGKAISAENLDHLDQAHGAIHELHDAMVPLYAAAGSIAPCERSNPLPSIARRSAGGHAGISDAELRSWGSEP